MARQSVNARLLRDLAGSERGQCCANNADINNSHKEDYGTKTHELNGLGLAAILPADPAMRLSMHTGSCLCGAVRFEVAGELPEASACHCSKCRKHTGNFEAGVDLPRSAVTISGADRLTWFHSSEKVRRGFCSVCGSSMFFDPIRLDWIGIMMGAFNGPTNTRISLHIFVADKGDYYKIADGVPQNAQ